jgi:uncharacterized Rmd1/YagE family protein
MHITEKLKLKDLRDRFSKPPVEFSNYELVIRYAEDSYVFVYNYGSIVFFNVPEELLERELSSIQEHRAPSDVARTSDMYAVEIRDMGASAPDNVVYFDRLVVQSLTYEKVKIVCMLLAESTALEYYEILIENLLEKANTFSRKLERQGRILESSEDFIKFIGMCLSTKQEILSNLYIVDSPDETWDSIELNKIYTEVKKEMEIDIRYRALEHKIQIVQESVEVIVDLSKTKRETLLEMIIILLFVFSIVIELIKIR